MKNGDSGATMSYIGWLAAVVLGPPLDRLQNNFVLRFAAANGRPFGDLVEASWRSCGVRPTALSVATQTLQ